MPDLLVKYPWLSLVPSLLTITIAIISRRVLLSLFLGIISGILILKGFSLESIKFLFIKIIETFYSNGSLDKEHIGMIIFLWMMGVVTYVVSKSGAILPFAQLILQKIKTRKSGQIFIMLLGILVFIDDYLNSLVVGSVSRPLCDRLGISRSKLAYLLDSTAAPVCVLAPLSSWGAAIIAVLASSITAFSIEGFTGLTLFLATIKYNFYPILALTLVFIVAYFKFDFGPMIVHEKKAQDNLIKDENDDLDNQYKWGKALGVILPIFVLLLFSVISLFITGKLELGSGDYTYIKIIEKADLYTSLIIGGMASIISCYFFKDKSDLKFSKIFKDLYEGFKIMLPVIIILIFAWILASITEKLHVGKYITDLINYQNFFSISYLPVFVFLIGGAMAFSTGSSFNTFTIMIPIVSEIAVNSDINLLVPMLSACLGGAVFGDHCSPISDTTILSSTGADCNHMDHVITQLPYCLLTAGVTFAGYIILGFSQSLIISFLSCFLILFIACFFIKIIYKN